MCGIAGIFNFENAPVDRDELERMNLAQAHRGPDGDGFYIRGRVGLAHRRLAIIDPKAGGQPFLNDNGSVALILNGEIYNYVELRSQLADDFAFRTNSDTEVLLRAYEKWGIACLDRLRGMFAFAIHDSRTQTLFVARDRVGIKPLFYLLTPHRLVFASEIAAILSARDVERRIRPESVSQFFRYQYIPAPATIYENLYKLEPGFFLLANTRTNAVTTRRYWNLAVDIKERSEEEALEELNALLAEIMRIHVRSDVPFGAFLSGGVDSSLVTAIMARELPGPVKTFSIGFQEERHSELPFASQAAKTVCTAHQGKVVTPDLAEEILALLSVRFGEPFADSSAVPTFYVSREAAREVKMVLSGDGGDELFGGYNSYRHTFKDHISRLRRLPLALLETAARLVPLQALRERALFGGVEQFREDHDAQRQIFRGQDLRDLIAPHLPVAEPVGFVTRFAGRLSDPITYFQAQDFKTYLVDDVLTKVDRMSMANSLEVRVPLLDHKLVEFAFTLPLSLKLRRGNGQDGVVTKHILKQSAMRFFPMSFLERPKQGFGIPVAEWLSGFLRPTVETCLRSASSPIYDWIDHGKTRTILDGFFAGNESLAAKVWFLLSFGLWVNHVHCTADPAAVREIELKAHCAPALRSSDGHTCEAQ
jgi:asparagine synthase (glutamine-hydrolysing)